MAELRFDGRVAVITGAGRGLGRAYALLLVARGAKVIVDDPDGAIRGEGGDARPAADVAADIEALGAKRSPAPSRLQPLKVVAPSSTAPSTIMAVSIR